MLVGDWETWNIEDDIQIEVLIKSNKLLIPRYYEFLKSWNGLSTKIGFEENIIFMCIKESLQHIGE